MMSSWYEPARLTLKAPSREGAGVTAARALLALVLFAVLTVPAPAGSFAIPWVEEHGGRPLVAASLDEAIAMVVQGRAEALVLDQPTLRWHLSKHPDLPVRLAPGVYDEHNFGFALREGSPLTRRLDIALLDLAESGRMERLQARWLGPDASP